MDGAARFDEGFAGKKCFRQFCVECACQLLLVESAWLCGWRRAWHFVEPARRKPLPSLPTWTSTAMPHRCAILDDYQKVALELADWSAVAPELDIEVFSEPLGDQRRTVEALRDAEIVCLMRERTPFPRTVIEALPKLKLIVTTGMRNAAIDVAAAQERGVVVCGTSTAHHPTAELAFGLMLDLARKISFEDGQLRKGVAWQTTIGVDLVGKTLGVL